MKSATKDQVLEMFFLLVMHVPYLVGSPFVWRFPQIKVALELSLPLVWIGRKKVLRLEALWDTLEQIFFLLVKPFKHARFVELSLTR